jgi:hypothetical protein
MDLVQQRSTTLKGIGVLMSQRLSLQLVLIHFALLLSVSVQAYAPDYYTVSEKATASGEVNLLNWSHHNEELPDPDQAYNRKKHYGTWVRERNDGTCFNTRAKVLIQSSEVPVTFANHGCAVTHGQWQDPYSNRQYTDASDIQIDHVVPLKNSYVSGGWKWDAKKRCLYANFRGNDYHLLAVNGPDNMKKGDRTPEKFMPPNKAYSCKYLSIWLKIKLIWNLAMIPSEAQAITALAQQNHCDAQTLSMPVQELNEQRQSIVKNANLCKNVP